MSNLVKDLHFFFNDDDKTIVASFTDNQGNYKTMVVNGRDSINTIRTKAHDELPQLLKDKAELEKRLTAVTAEKATVQKEKLEAVNTLNVTKKAKKKAEDDLAETQALKAQAEAGQAEAETRAAAAERRARELSRLVATTITGSDLSAEEEAEVVALLPPWQAGVSYDKGDVVGYKGKVALALAAHISALDNAPGKGTGKWSSDVAGTPAAPKPYIATNTYNKGDRVIWSGVVYQSKIDGNISAPDKAPYNWDLVSTDD